MVLQVNVLLITGCLVRFWFLLRRWVRLKWAVFAEEEEEKKGLPCPRQIQSL